MNLPSSKLLKLWRVLFTNDAGYSWQHLRNYIAQNGTVRDINLLAYFETFKNSAFSDNRSHKLSAADAYKTLKIKTVPSSQKQRDAQIYNALSSLYNLTERYLWAKAADENPFVPPYQVLLQLYTHHDLAEHFKDYWRSLTLLQENLPLTHRNFYENLHLAEAYALFNALTKSREEAVSELKKVDDALHSLLITKVLEYSINVRFAEGAFNTQFNNPFLNPILSYLATNRAWAKGFPLLYAYATLYRILQEHDRRWLAAWLHFIAQHTAQFDRAELRKLYSYAENIAATIINKNTSDIAAYALLFTIYSQQQKLGFFLESDNSMDEGKFRNYVNIAIKCSELTAAASFITSYEGSLNTIHKDDIVQYAQALVLFETRKFDEVIHNIRLNTFREEDFLLRAEIVLIKAWFERVETEHSDKGRHLEHGTCDIIQAFEQKIGAATSIAAAPRQKFNTTVFAFTQLVVLFDTTKKGYVKTDKKAELLALVDWFLAQANLLDKTWFLLKCNRF